MIVFQQLTDFNIEDVPDELSKEVSTMLSKTGRINLGTNEQLSKALGTFKSTPFRHLEALFYAILHLACN